MYVCIYGVDPASSFLFFLPKSDSGKISRSSLSPLTSIIRDFDASNVESIKVIETRPQLMHAFTPANCSLSSPLSVVESIGGKRSQMHAYCYCTYHMLLVVFIPPNRSLLTSIVCGVVRSGSPPIGRFYLGPFSLFSPRSLSPVT